MIKIVTRWDASQMTPEVEFRMWRQLMGSFDVQQLIVTPTIYGFENGIMRQADTFEEALELCGDMPRVFLEPDGMNNLYELPRGTDMALIIGNTEHSNMAFAEPDETYRIDTPAGPKRSHLYGPNAAAIALAYYWGQ